MKSGAEEYDVKGAAERVIAYLKTPEGLAAMEESNRRVEETIALLNKSRVIPQELLHAPFTI